MRNSSIDMRNMSAASNASVFTRPHPKSRIHWKQFLLAICVLFIRQSESVSGDQIAEALHSLRKYKLGLWARFEQTPDGRIQAILNAGFTKENRSNWTRTVVLDKEHGIPLLKTAEKLRVETPSEQDRVVFDKVTKSGSWTARELNHSKGKFRFTKHLWSQDGRWLFLLSYGESGRLYQIDTKTWAVNSIVRPTWRENAANESDFFSSVLDITWCTEGLVLLSGVPNQARDDVRETGWTPIEGAHGTIPERGPGIEFGRRLLILDPQTFALRKSWFVYADKIAGNRETDLVYLWREPSVLSVFNTKSGELVNGLDLRDSHPAKQEWLIPQQNPKHTFHVSFPSYQPSVSSDNQWLLLTPHMFSRQLSTVNRFRIDGRHLTYESILYGPQHTENNVSFYPIPSNDAKYLPIPTTGDQIGVIVDLADFSRHRGVINQRSNLLPSPTLIGMEPGSKSFFLSGPRESSPDLPRHDIVIVRNGSRLTIPVDAEIWSFQSSTERAGMMAYGSTSSYWIEGGQPAKEWTFDSREQFVKVEQFENRADSTIPTSEKIVGQGSAYGSVEYDLNTRWFQWLPDGNSFLAVCDDDRLHLFDAKTMTETHQRSLPGQHDRVELSGAGIIIQGLHGLHLCDPRNLAEVAFVEGLRDVVGNPAHTLWAGTLNGDLLVMDGENQEVIARTELKKLQVDEMPFLSEQQPLQMTFLPDGQHLLVLRDNSTLLSIEDGRLNIEKVWRSPGFPNRAECSIDDSGRYCAVAGELFDLNAVQNWRFQLALRVPCSGRPQITFNREEYVRLSEGSAEHESLLNVQRLDQTEKPGSLPAHLKTGIKGAVRIAPHPKDPNRFLIDGYQKGSTHVRVLRDVTLSLH